VMTSGEAIGTYPADSGDSGSIRFGAREVLGVTSLARAQASDIQVIAATDVTAIRIPGEVVARVLQEQPALSNQFARIWQARAEVLRRSGQQANDLAQIANGPVHDSDA
jgi:CRP-like cAMP-binding protein